MAESVVLVPGIGFGGGEMAYLAWSLRRAGFDARTLYKNPWRRSLSESAGLLRAFIADAGFQTPHLVAHSLGGHVVARLLSDYPDLPVGRIVLLGSPISGCVAARRVMRIPGGRWPIGEALGSVAVDPKLSFPPNAEIASIAGRINLLLGYVLCPGAANDTLVSVDETRHSAFRAHHVVTATHTSMLFSGEVVRLVRAFLSEGRERESEE